MAAVIDAHPAGLTEPRFRSVVAQEPVLLRMLTVLQRWERAPRGPLSFPIALAVLAATVPLWLPACLLYAQILPALVWRWLGDVKPALAWTTDEALLARVEDWYAINLTLVRRWRPFALWRRRAYDALIDELDEELDSLRLTRERGPELRALIAELQDATRAA